VAKKNLKGKSSGKPLSATTQKGVGKGGKPPAWWVFTTKSTIFVDAARRLSIGIKHRYGDDVSISHFEKMLGEFSTLTAEQRGLLNLDNELLALYQKFIDTRKIRDAERDSFRNYKVISTIEGSLEKVQQFLDSNKSEEEEDERVADEDLPDLE
jgi:hypothetical protein